MRSSYTYTCAPSPPLQTLLLLGRASLAVVSGELSVFGSSLTAASGPVEVCADVRCGGALALQPGAAVGQVPLASSGEVVLTLTRCCSGGGVSGGGAGGAAAAEGPRGGSPPREHHQQQQQWVGEAVGGGIGRDSLGFDAALAGSSAAAAAGMAAHPLPQLWHQVVAEVEESLDGYPQEQQQQQHGWDAPGMPPAAAAAAPPPVIVVCGAKNVGKSTFARLLANTLISKYGAVAYLDTGVWGGGGRGGPERQARLVCRAA